MTINTWLHPKRFLYSLAGFTFASVLSYYGPRVYLQYLDNHKYVDVANLITFDRKVYSAGETQTAKMTLKILISGNITLKSRLMLILVDNQYRVIKQTQIESFVVAKPDPQTFIVDASLPCNLAEGKYFYRGEIQYEIKDIQKFTDFDTDFFTVDNNRASDSAQIAENCKI